MSFGIDSEAHAALQARFPSGPTRWVGLSETEPVFASSGYTGITEPTATSYARVQVDPADWSTPADRATQADVIYPDTTEDLGDLGWWFLADDADTGAGVVSWVGRFADPLVLAAGTSNITLPLRVEAPSSFTTNA